MALVPLREATDRGTGGVGRNRLPVWSPALLAPSNRRVSNFDPGQLHDFIRHGPRGHVPIMVGERCQGLPLNGVENAGQCTSLHLDRLEAVAAGRNASPPPAANAIGATRVQVDPTVRWHGNEGLQWGQAV